MRRSIARFLAVVACGAVIVDVATTWAGLSCPGLVEANPVMASVIGSVGAGPALVLRGIVGVSVPLLAWLLAVDPTRPRGVHAATGVVLVAVASVSAYVASTNAVLVASELGFAPLQW